MYYLLIIYFNFHSIFKMLIVKEIYLYIIKCYYELKSTESLKNNLILSDYQKTKNI